MQEATCNRCGASVLFSAKYCRQCGNPLDPSELTTRSLDAPAEPPPYEHPTRPANAGVTAPTYPPAMVPPQPPAPVYWQAPPSSNKRLLLMILAVFAACLIGLGIAAFFAFGSLSGPPPLEPPPIGEKRPQPGTGPAPPPPPPAPGVPREAPPPRPQGDVVNPFDASLIYPGAKTVMSVNSNEGRVAQLLSSDPLEKVADFYMKKLNPTQDTNLPGSRILKGNGITVILAGGEGGTHITMTDGKD